MVERKVRVLGFSLLFVALLSLVPAAAITIQGPTRTPKSKTKVSETTTAKRRVAKLRHHRRHRYYERFYTSSFADDVTTGDVTAGEDPIVRAAAIDALGNMNGTVVAIEPTSGRILAMVNQKLALAEGAQPCSTFKVAVALAALNEKLITPETQIKLGRRVRLNLTEVLHLRCLQRQARKHPGCGFPLLDHLQGVFYGRCQPLVAEAPRPCLSGAAPWERADPRPGATRRAGEHLHW